MLLYSENIFTRLKRSAIAGLAAAGLFCAYIPLHAQERAGGERHKHGMERIDQEEGARRLEAFRNQRLQGDFYFKFRLEHKPRKARTVRYDGEMWGTWNEQGPITRFRIYPKKNSATSDESESVELIVQNGPSQSAWIRRSEDSTFELLEGAALFEPILPEVLYTPFDLQMPFVYWDDFIYEGPTLVGASRVAQQFLMLPPESLAAETRGIAGVRIGLDDTYNALWRVELVDDEGEELSRFSVESFKEVQEQYIVKRITLKDNVSRDSTTFHVSAASVGLSLKSQLFDPADSIHATQFVPKNLEKL